MDPQSGEKTCGELLVSASKKINEAFCKSWESFLFAIHSCKLSKWGIYSENMNKVIAVRFNNTQLAVYVNDDRLYIV